MQFCYFLFIYKKVFYIQVMSVATHLSRGREWERRVKVFGQNHIFTSPNYLIHLLRCCKNLWNEECIHMTDVSLQDMFSLLPPGGLELNMNTQAFAEFLQHDTNKKLLYLKKKKNNFSLCSVVCCPRSFCIKAIVKTLKAMLLNWRMLQTVEEKPWMRCYWKHQMVIH